MAYTKSRPGWRDLPSLETPVKAEHIEHWEDGIARAHEIADAAVPMPSGGTDGQVLAKSGAGVVWTNPPASSGGGIFLDADGVPYFDTTATGGGSIALDADGVPYVTGV
ncbi:hypothetical protein [Rhodococcus pyridinivorans]|uniref:hypothetical protein n=1 Tax=Rhodococcus pyridinivorans TaxID=103816 RepID=UPI003AAF628A